MKHCPNAPNHDNDDPIHHGGSTTILYERPSSHIRGVFALPESNPEGTLQKLWFLSTPGRMGKDYIEELDLRTGNVIQVLRIPGTNDAHDVVLVKKSLFLCDTRTGNVLELELPQPQTDPTTTFSKEYLNATMGHKEKNKMYPDATILKLHEGFDRADHINNIAVAKDVLLLSLHGTDGLKKKVKEKDSVTRLSALARNKDDVGISGRELVLEDGFRPVEDAGVWNHGIAFWEDKDENDEEQSQIKFITLDSKHGSLVSVVVSGPGSDVREREVLWVADTTHPTLQLPTDENGKRVRYKGMISFTKGLAVQGDVAYFGVSTARKFREHISPTLLVAVNLKTKEE
eukprot:12974532-Ditylum_brightwellii.AAC.1